MPSFLNCCHFVLLLVAPFATSTLSFATPYTPGDGADTKSRVQNDHATFEAVTGDSADEDKSAWDTFYKNKNFIFGKEPVSFLKDYIRLIPKGRAFVPAMGEGRNAIFIAKKGFTVDGNDFSDVAVDKALAEAKLQHVQLKAVGSDLNVYRFPENYYDFVCVSMFYQKSLMPQFKKTVKKGGYIMFYQHVLDEMKKPSKVTLDDFAVKPSEIKDELKDFKIVTYKEYVDHGTKVVGILARKL